MSFFDSLKSAAKSAGSYATSQMEEVQEYKAKYDGLSNEQIYKRYQSSSGARKMACYQLLKERGFNPNSSD